MMKNHFATYHQSQALEKLGFDLPCIATIDQTEYIQIKGAKTFPRGAMMYDTIDLPLKSQVLQWFRDKYQLHGSIQTDCTTYPKFCYVVNEFFGNPKDLTEKEWGWEDGLYSVLYRDYSLAEKELIDYLISKIDEGYEID